MATGTATLDFGAFPGATDASVAVTGQGGIVSGSLVEAWIRPVATSDHSADEHLAAPLKVIAGNIVAATGFTIYGLINAIEFGGDAIDGAFSPKPRNGLRLYGAWTVAWAWT
jgi:hypothetical protein